MEWHLISKISSVSEAAKINSINLRKHQIYTHQQLNRCLPRENRQHFPIYESQRMVDIQLTEDKIRLIANVLNSNRSISEVI
jgi:hypothetical protein